MKGITWTLCHSWESPFDEPPPGPDEEVRDAGHLRIILQRKASGPPFSYVLKPSDGAGFSIRLGGPWGAASYAWPTARGISFRAARYDSESATEEVHFEDGREGCLLGPDDLVPVVEAIAAAVHYFEHRELTPRLRWVGWDD